ncbi:4-(cytidine 5'-diphospho)-2-C-methyl-D-erythritol kinase [Gammaproteobacteria bacterium]
MFYSWPAPAKLNLMLRITGRRSDGYHTLQTIFQFLDYGDTLHLRVREDGMVNRLTDLAGVAAEQDITVRAARLLQREAGTTLGIDIRLDKILPLGGGLGGGSSNAATVLVALNQQWGLNLSEDELAGLGLRLGADVPVFVRGRAAWGEGVGEQLTPIDLPEPWYLVVIPDCRVATGDIFSDPELTRDSLPITMRAFLAGDDRNDCERVVRYRYPAVAAALDWLGTNARLTGTGACVYAPFTDAAAAEAVLERLPSEWHGFVARGRNRSPLTERCPVR